jgi:hypothetical protein
MPGPSPLHSGWGLVFCRGGSVGSKHLEIGVLWLPGTSPLVMIH